MFSALAVILPKWSTFNYTNHNRYYMKFFFRFLVMFNIYIKTNTLFKFTVL